MSHSFAGKAAYLAGDQAVAVLEFSKARDTFLRAPQTPATAQDRVEAEAWIANAEISGGDLRKASSLLESIKPSLSGSAGQDAQIEYYIAKANLGVRDSATAAPAVEDALRSALFLSEWSLRTFPNDHGRKAWADQYQDAYRDAVEWKFRQGDAASSLELWEWFKGSDIRADQVAVSDPARAQQNSPDPTHAPAIPTPTSVANLLPSLHDQTFVAFATFYDGIAVWAYDDRGIFSAWLNFPQGRIRELSFNLRQLCSDPTSDMAVLRTAAQALYNFLVKPVEGRLDPTRTLILEPDTGYLSSIPWEALVDSNGRFLAQRFATVISPGFYWDRKHPSPSAITPATSALVVSVPSSPAEDVIPLIEADGEGGTVSGMFSQSLWLRNASATTTAIQQDMRGKGVFHFVGHAVASPQRSGLVLAEVDPATNRSRLFGAEKLRHSDLSGLQLAVLSACPLDFDGRALETAEDALPGSFLRAGVPHVVASRWNVDSAQTSVFMAAFYKKLLAGTSVPSSMQAARLALASSPAAHPYYWSAFELRGMP